VIVEGTYTFAGPRDLVWELLQDPAVLSKALPGTRRLERVSEDRFEGEMNVGVGPVTAGAFAVSVTLSDKVPPERFTMQVEGKGGIGFTRGSASVELTEQDGATVMTYRADMKVGGKIAGVGQRLLDSAARTMTKQGLDAMNRELQSRLTGVPVPAPRRGRLIAVGITILVLLMALILIAIQ
jgi:carbon monoxide dehydrogenase subunit G